MVLNYASARQDDTVVFRAWEVAGTAHSDTYTLSKSGGLPRDPALGAVIGCAGLINDGPHHESLQAALFHLVAGVLASRRLPAGSLRARRSVFTLGVTLLIGAGALSSWARRHLGRFHRDDLTVHDDHSLVDTGPYESVRHPLYLATTSALVGIGAVLGNWVSIATAGLPTAALVRRIAVEESMLERHLGPDYESYRARTKRLVPGIW